MEDDDGGGGGATIVGRAWDGILSIPFVNIFTP